MSVKNCVSLHCIIIAVFIFHLFGHNCAEFSRQYNAPDMKQFSETFSDLRLATSNTQNIKQRSKLKSNYLHAPDAPIHGFEDSQIVIPIRLHHVTGNPISHGRHFCKRVKSAEEHPEKRRKRSTYKLPSLKDDRSKLIVEPPPIRNTPRFNDVKFKKYDGTTRDSLLNDVNEPTIANYSISAFGEQLVFHLTTFDSFLAPNYALRFLGNAEEKEKSYRGAARHCYYSGHVGSNRSHKAIFSICNGLFGAFRTDTSEYLIQPEKWNLDGDDEGTKPHKIFKRSTRSAGTHGKLMCGFVDSENSKENSFSSNQTANLNTVNDFESILDHKTEAYTRKKKLRQRMINNRQKKTKVFSRQVKTESIPPLKSVHILEAKTNRSVSTNYRRSWSHGNSLKAAKEKPVLSRKKRYLSLPRNVEVMVTADNDMVNSHEDVEHYVLTLMAIVNHIFHDQSIGNLINIVVVELVLIGNSQIETGPEVVRDAYASLRNFCLWQHEHNNPDDSHPIHYDTAVLITGRDICRSKAACDTLGLAELGTMCNQKRSCSINEDNGLSTAFTIAHEIGHLLNAPHDNSGKCLSARGHASTLNVMSPTLDNNAHPWTWSECSAKHITEFLDNRNGECLLDEPPTRLHSLPVEEPGKIFSASDQCKFIYGDGTKHCDFMFHNSCKRLWCTSKDIRNGCKTPHLPWADGTRCGDRMWCQMGLCVPENRHRLPLDGSWGEWGEFGACSRTCGGGVKISERKCNNPRPQYGGQYCVGRRKKFRSCNAQTCPTTRSFRAEQCASFNDWSSRFKYRIKGIPSNAEWIPKYDGIPERDKCKLTCKVLTNGPSVSWYVLRPRVINGTPCGPDSSSICVEGECKEAGCDHVLGSNAAEDRCAVCNGDGKSCREVRGIFNSGSMIGYNRVAIIPAGARRIWITQQSQTGDSQDNNYLALRETNGNYILNGNRSVMKSKQKVVRRSNDGSGKSLYNCDYSGTDSQIEFINCSIPISVNITLELLAAGTLDPPNINYQYNIPVEVNRLHRWHIDGSWEKCSKECSGKTKKKVVCVDFNDKKVPDRKCSDSRKPVFAFQSCNTHCAFRWHAMPANCSARCGQGTMFRLFKCKKVEIRKSHESQGERVLELVNEKFCSQRKPHSVVSCHGECLPTSWSYGDWSKCSATCGNGIQTREKKCQDTKGNQFDFSECKGSGESITRSCAVTKSCPEWLVGAFSECSLSCGSGFQTRRVWCSIGGETLLDDDCNVSKKPATSQPCNEHGCPRWKFVRWTECSVTCGDGSMKRVYECVDYSGRVLENSFCNSALLRSETHPCSTSQSCDAWEWIHEESNGFPSIIFRNLPEKDRRLKNKPTAITTVTTSEILKPTSVVSHIANNIYFEADVINAHRQVATWRTGSWTPCSATCGAGIRLRYVSCRHVSSMEEAIEESCGQPKEKPPSRETCQIRPCFGKWRTGDWSLCSASCGKGNRFRLVRCLYDNGYQDDEAHCISGKKPTDIEPCNSHVLCSSSSSTPSLSTKLVTLTEPTARLQNKNNVSSRDDATVTSPSSTTVKIRKAPFTTERRKGSWRTGSWSQCSISCDGGIQKRAVQCLDLIGQPASCDDETKPISVQKCMEEKCPKWRHGEWGECSRSCGGGNRTRMVICVSRDTSPNDDKLCDAAHRPKSVEVCNLRSCRRRYHWRKGLWSSCSATCGRGMKIRSVQCFHKKGFHVLDEKCANMRRNKPREVRRCSTQKRCPKWRSGSWTTCSSSCGNGVQVRRVACKYKRKKVMDHLCDVAVRPDNEKSCNSTPCSVYYWQISAWSECSVSCGIGSKRRYVKCRNLMKDKIVNSSYCDLNQTNPKPSPMQSCNDGPCTSYWSASPWQECSVSCGSGIQRRKISCVNMNYFSYVEADANNCRMKEKPHDVRDCNWGSCDAEIYWRAGPWSECSASCGIGTSIRKVVCTDRKMRTTVSDHYCLSMPSFKPETERQCANISCIPQTCLQLQQQHEIFFDGEFFLEVKEKMLKIYCKNMNTTKPLEYLTLLNEDENFSEMFGLRLIDPSSCPANGSRLSHCACHRGHPEAGKTIFRKLRINIRNLRVIENDFTFAVPRLSKLIPFGEAGDCYSRSNCPQGRFRVNLKGTNLTVSEKTKWISFGIDSAMQVDRSNDGQVVDGKCGGYCSRCQPDPSIGLLLDYKF